MHAIRQQARIVLVGVIAFVVVGCGSDPVSPGRTHPAAGEVGAADEQLGLTLRWRKVSKLGEGVIELNHVGRTLFALTAGGLQRSDTRGVSWVPVPVNMRIGALSTMDVDGDDLYLSSYVGLRYCQGITHSRDRGKTFNMIFRWCWDGASDVDFARGGVGWAAVPNCGSKSGSHRKLRCGDWEQKKGGDAVRVVVDAGRPRNVAYSLIHDYGQHYWARRTLNGGDHWLKCEHPVHSAFVIDGVPTAFATTAFTTDYGRTWRSLGLTTQHTEAIGDGNWGACSWMVHDEARGRLFAAAANGGVYTGLPGNWELYGLGRQRIRSLTICGNYLYALSCEEGAVFRRFLAAG